VYLLLHKKTYPIMNELIEQVTTFISKLIGYIPQIVFVYLALSITHYVSSNLYPALCTPLTITGFIMAPFIVVTPHCQGLRWIIHYTGDQIRNTWVWVGSYLVYSISQYITPYFIKNENKDQENHDKTD
jgi:hypothetical protein